MMKCFWVLASVLVLVSQIAGVGHKQRQALNKLQANELDAGPRSSGEHSGDVGKQGGGHKQRSRKLDDGLSASDKHSEHVGRQGGHKQRRSGESSYSSSASTRTNLDLPLTRQLIKDWANGEISSKQVQRYALSAEQQVLPQ